MFCIHTCEGSVIEFNTTEELKEYIEIRHAEDGGFDWISEIKDEGENYYGCSWKLEIERL
jgi:hypothetical protein